MWPLVLLAAIGYPGLKLARECTNCRERLKWTNTCIRCSDPICTTCGSKLDALTLGGRLLRGTGWVCPGYCEDVIHERDAKAVHLYDEEQKATKNRLERISKVRLVNVNYGGTQKPKIGATIETNWHEERSDAEESARAQAVDEYDCDTIWYVNAVSQKFQGSSLKNRTYYYRAWKVTGKV